MPLVSVVIPVYNGETYIAQAIDSILGQTMQDFELCLVDDGSTDGSLRVLQSFAARDRRCRVITGPNRGTAVARNLGLAAANGEFVAAMDADDICRPRRFEKQLAYLREHRECVAVGSRVMFIDPDGLHLCEMLNLYTHEEIEAALLKAKLGIVHPSCMLRKSAVDNVGGYRPSDAEDLDLFLRLAETGRLANLQEVLLEYRQHLSSASYKRVAEQAISARKIIHDACVRRRMNWPDVEADLGTIPMTAHPAEVHRKWGWWALSGRNLAAARKHAFLALKGQPNNMESWRLVACALRGH